MNQNEGEGVLPLPNAPEISAAELDRVIGSGESLQIMDIRAPDRVERGRIDLVPPERFHNMRGSDLINCKDASSTGLAPEIPVTLVCGHGFDSKVLAVHLGRLGFEANSLTGGMAAWMRLTVPVEIDPPEGLDRIVQFDRRGKGCLGYLLVSGEEAVIVDPPFSCEGYLEVLGASGATLVGVFDTHAHADYVSGATRLARQFQVPYYLHPLDAVYPYDGAPGSIEYVPVSDGDQISVGRSKVDVMHTPGHTAGSTTLLLEDRIALTGDFLFVESIGRPDLGGKEEEWAASLWDSVVRAIRHWDDGMAVYPAHYGSERERRMGEAVGVHFGALRRENELLRVQESDLFIHLTLKQKAAFPEDYKKIKAINLGLARGTEKEIEELEIGWNECALGGATKGL